MMNRGKTAKLGLVTLFSTLALGTFVVQNNIEVNAAPLGTELQYYLNDPTPAPSKFSNIWDSNGYDLQPVTFTLHGDTNSPTGVINDNRINVEWYEKAPGKTKTEYLGKSNSVSYTTANTTASDNGTQYQAKITLKEGSKSTTIKTNWATLYASY